ncbi:MAG: hypothetical protein CVU00_01880 [Bacteroidetes bacterium HGW-Bacteroidetes-17]|jgi:hypothetical protein|nr:MAG: hypothetical protein CVU00_01880 [Bacteroidetes bacterium HGW-Bacteroidetes-17]
MIKLKTKEMKDIIKKTGSLFILTFLLSFAVVASNYEKAGKIDKEFEINQHTRIEFTNKSSDLLIRKWDKQAVRLECNYKLKANEEEDIAKTIEALENLKVENSANLLAITTSIFTNVKSTILPGLMNKIVATLSNGTSVNLSEYEIEYVLTLPDNHDFKLFQKYSDLNMPDYSGNLELDLYDVDVRAGRLVNAKMLTSKYSNIIVGALGDCEVDIYDTDVEVETMGLLNMKSKYSKFEVDVVGAVNIDSYDDKLFFYSLESIKGQAKYTDFEIGNIKSGDLDLYDCELKAKDCEKLKLVGKYSGIVFNNIGIFEFPDCYDNKVDAKTVGEFSTISKYTEFNFERITGMIDFETYDDRLTVGQVDEDFYAIKINGKYAKIDLDIVGNPKFFIDVDFKYTSHELPPDLLFSNIDTKSSKFVASGRTEGLKSTDEVKVNEDNKGIRKANIGKITIEQYDGTLKIK